MSEILTVAEAAKILGVSPGTLREWEKKGLLKSDRTAGKHRRYTREYIEQMRTNGPPQQFSKWWYFKLWEVVEKQRKQAALSKYGAFLNRFNLERGWEPEDIAMIIDNCLTCQQFVDGIEPATSLEMVDLASWILSSSLLSLWVRVGAISHPVQLLSYQRLRGVDENRESLVEESEDIVCSTLDFDDEFNKLEDRLPRNLFFDLAMQFIQDSETADFVKLIYFLEMETLSNIASSAATVCHTWPGTVELIVERIKEVCDFIDKKIHWKFPKWVVMDCATYGMLRNTFDEFSLNMPSRNRSDCMNYVYLADLDCCCYPYDMLKPNTIIIGCKPHRNHFGYAFNFYIPLLKVKGRPTSVYSQRLMREGAKFFGTISDRDLQWIQ